MKLKISRLFHWLYATLMFLPILMFIPSCLYFAFNEHATNETTTEINYKYQSNEVNTLDDLVVGNIYHLDQFVIEDDVTIYVYQCESYTHWPANLSLESQYLDENTYLWFSLEGNELIITYCINNNAIDLYKSNYTLDYPLQLNNIVFQFSDELYSIFYDRDYLPEYTDYNVIESVDTNVEQTIPQQINNAWASVWNLPVFSWTQNSFITAPFSYITGLFGLSSDNSLNYVFTYFASISICWLVFDLIMYVPNLAHRWLDRSAIE